MSIPPTPENPRGYNEYRQNEVNPANSINPTIREISQDVQRIADITPELGSAPGQAKPAWTRRPNQYTLFPYSDTNGTAAQARLGYDAQGYFYNAWSFTAGPARCFAMGRMTGWCGDDTEIMHFLTYNRPMRFMFYNVNSAFINAGSIMRMGVCFPYGSAMPAGGLTDVGTVLEYRSPNQLWGVHHTGATLKQVQLATDSKTGVGASVSFEWDGTGTIIFRNGAGAEIGRLDNCFNGTTDRNALFIENECFAATSGWAPTVGEIEVSRL